GLSRRVQIARSLRFLVLRCPRNNFPTCVFNVLSRPADVLAWRFRAPTAGFRILRCDLLLGAKPPSEGVYGSEYQAPTEIGKLFIGRFLAPARRHAGAKRRGRIR